MTGQREFLDYPGEAASHIRSIDWSRTLQENAMIFLAYDNADMSAYILRLLSGIYDVHTFGDGLSALAAIKESPPDLVLTDVIMPGLNGFELLAELRRDPATKAIPVIMLSAPTGEGSGVKGLIQGADDYLVKPFSARELVARISTQLSLARVRRDIQKREQEELAAIKSLYNLSTRPANPDNMGELMEEILNTAISLSGADMGTFQLYDDTEGVLKITAHNGFQQTFLDFFSEVSPGHGAACGKALELQQRVIVENISQSPVFAGSSALAILLTAGVQAVQSTPLISREGRLVGMLTTHYRRTIRKDELDLRHIDLLAGQAADIIVQVQAQNELRLKEAELRRHRDNLAQLVEEQVREMKRNARHYRTLVTNAPLEFAIFDKNSRCVYVSPDSQNYYNQNMIGKAWWDQDLPESQWLPWQEKFDEVLATRGKVVFETKYPDKNGEYRDLFVHVVPEMDEAGEVVALLLFALDITERKKLESELLRLDRLNTIGEMAAAIGHEVRNPLTTVRGYLQLFQGKKESACFREQFELMIEELDRANGIISDFLSLAKNKAIELTNNNLNDVINWLLPLLQSEALCSGHGLEIDSAEVPDFAMDKNEIRQLLLNLACNAFEAMESGGNLTIRTRNENGTVVLSVHDTGTGIPQKVLEKLGTPFISTKENGTGLGLAVCYRIAERHGAKIDVKTSPAGTIFTIIFKS